MVTSSEPTRRRRAVVLVGGPAAPYSRAMRIGRALAAEGFTVEIAAVAAAGLPDREPVAPAAAGAAGEPEPQPGAAGPIEIRRYRPSGIWAWLGASEGLTSGASGSPGARPRRGTALRRAVRLMAAPLIASRRWAFWPHTVRGWWATLARDLEPADLYHACGSLTIAAALAARDRQATPSIVIYDAIDNVTESNEALGLPGLVRRRNARTEAAWARAADAVVTVNDPLAARLGERWRLGEPPLVIANLPEPIAAVSASADRIREATSLSRSTRIVLFQGRVGPNLGLDEAADAVLEIEDAALVILGFGRGMVAARARDHDPRYVGRHVTLPAVHPDDLLAWTASADVALIPLPPVSVNQRLSTPNKLWEALAAGTPVVVVSGLEVMERLVREHDLGAVAASTDPRDLAIAIREVLDRLGRDGDAWREHVAATARERFSWPAVATAYRSLVRSVSGRPENDGGAASQST